MSPWVQAPGGFAAACTDLLPQHEKDLLQWCCLVRGGTLIACYLRVRAVGVWVGACQHKGVAGWAAARHPAGAAARTSTHPLPSFLPLSCPGTQDVVSVLQLHDWQSGTLKAPVPMPGIGSVGGFSGSHKHTEWFFSFTSYTEPVGGWVGGQVGWVVRLGGWVVRLGFF